MLRSPFHYTLHDATGQSIVIEFVGGQREGLGTVTVATEAANGVLIARTVQNEARSAALVAAASLAFALGEMRGVGPGQ